MLLRLHHISRISCRRTPNASCNTTQWRAYSDSAEDSIKRLQNAFQTPGSPFYLAPGERGPSEPHDWPEHDTASAFMEDHTESEVESGLGDASVSSSAGVESVVQQRPSPSEPTAAQKASQKVEHHSTYLGWPHNLPQYTLTRSQGASYARKHGFDTESMVEWPVAWGEQDQFRHVNNVAFARYFETARVRAMQAFEPFMSPQTFQEFMLVIMSRPTDINPQKSSFGLRQAAWSLEQGKVVAECTSVQVMYDFKGLKKGVMTEEVKRALDVIAGRCLKTDDA
ncbi:hypothetical protein QFC21_000751 [Naganishia friedmannii]|uniref:Uncharacterized protein n=1 Tax=Naganishia friedmannii TaxID=89922 RepID=A0ACC2W797_9TREE|nr:hypothetical protein QFC21_000751 [Naganishia friedmannii]